MNLDANTYKYETQLVLGNMQDDVEERLHTGIVKKMQKAVSSGLYEVILNIDFKYFEKCPLEAIDDIIEQIIVGLQEAGFVCELTKVNSDCTYANLSVSWKNPIYL